VPGIPLATQSAPARGVAPVGASENVLRWSSEVGEAIDYYFIYGPGGEASLRNYRDLTGAAPLMPEWLLGFWQSKERYRTEEEVLAVAKQYRDLKVPIDGMIQDWRYWPDNTWGSHAFDKARYPDPAAMTKQLHDMHYHILISVWPKFDLGTPNIQELEKAGAMFDPVIPYVFPPGLGKWYDPFADKGREIYWKQVSGELFSKGFDGWWLDASEAELSGKWGEFRGFTTAQGAGATVFNAYPLEHTRAVYEGQRAETADKRVFILTRSGYAGQQRNAAVVWSGIWMGLAVLMKGQVALMVFLLTGQRIGTGAERAGLGPDALQRIQQLAVSHGIHRRQPAGAVATARVGADAREQTRCGESGENRCAHHGGHQTSHQDGDDTCT